MGPSRPDKGGAKTRLGGTGRPDNGIVVSALVAGKSGSQWNFRTIIVMFSFVAMMLELHREIRSTPPRNLDVFSILLYQSKEYGRS